MRRIVEMLSSVTGFPIDDNEDGLLRGCTSQEVPKPSTLNPKPYDFDAYGYGWCLCHSDPSGLIGNFLGLWILKP